MTIECVFGIIFLQTFVRRYQIMERVAEPKKSILSQFINTYSHTLVRPNFTVYPQMPAKQIQHNIMQAVRNEHLLTIQLNPNSLEKEFTEVTGSLSLSPTSSHIILTTIKKQTVYLIQPQQVRHVRLAP